MDKEQIYNKLPIFLQNVVCSVEGFKLKRKRLNIAFFRFLEEYQSRDQWTYAELCHYRDERLREIILHAYNTVPYYNELFKKLALIPADVQSIEDLKNLPILTKDDVRVAGDAMLSSDFKKHKLIQQSTSGSTGASLQLYYTKEVLQEQFALWWKYRINLGLSMDMWCADFGSRTVVPVDQKKPPFWRISTPLKQVKFSAFHGTEENFFQYYLEIKRRNLRWIHGYPTVITPFAAFLINNNLDLRGQIDFVTTGGENLYDFQKDIMLKGFGVKAYSHYGLAECVANFSDDKDHNQIVDEDFAAVEFLENGDTFKIIGTSLGNYAMPLIRYDTGDLAFIDKHTEPRMIKFIDGRNGEYILLKSGSKVGALSALFSDTETIVEAQIRQKLDYNLEIKFVSSASSDKIQKDLELVKSKLRARVGGEIDFKFVQVSQIPRTKGGKLRYIISDFHSQFTV